MNTYIDVTLTIVLICILLFSPLACLLSLVLYIYNTNNTDALIAFVVFAVLTLAVFKNGSMLLSIRKGFKGY